MTKISFEWGLTAIFALPLAIGFHSDPEWGDSTVMLHVGPLYFALSWRTAG